jgi:cold shock CspA family protein
MVMETGIVQWFNDAKGFGFVETEKGDQIICEKYHVQTLPKTLKERQRISFNRTFYEGREFCTEISVLEDEAIAPPPVHYNVIAKAIVDNCGFPYSLIEAIDIYNYDVGRYLDLHHDYPYFPDKINYYSHGENDRVGTGILYLNDDYEGGTTYFPKLGVDVKPKKGSLLYFKQCYDEATNWSTIHESKVIKQGTKWIASCFFSEKERIGFTDRSEFMPEENPTFDEPFYVKKFMDIQRANVQLYRKLKRLEESEMADIIEKELDEDFFKNLDNLVK